MDKLDKIIKENIDKLVNEYIESSSYNQQMPLNEMARIRQRKSGLPMIVWLNPNDGTNTGNHNMPRMKFQDNTNARLIPNEMIPISIHNSKPTILVKNYIPKLSSQTINKLKEWIIKNYSVLISYWNGEIFEDELMDSIQSV